MINKALIAIKVNNKKTSKSGITINKSFWYVTNDIVLVMFTVNFKHTYSIIYHIYFWLKTCKNLLGYFIHSSGGSSSLNAAFIALFSASQPVDEMINSISTGDNRDAKIADRIENQRWCLLISSADFDINVLPQLRDLYSEAISDYYPTLFETEETQMPVLTGMSVKVKVRVIQFELFSLLIDLSLLTVNLLNELLLLNRGNFSDTPIKNESKIIQKLFMRSFPCQMWAVAGEKSKDAMAFF